MRRCKQRTVLLGGTSFNSIVCHPISGQRGCIGQYVNVPNSAVRVHSGRICVSNITTGGPRGVRLGCFIRASNSVLDRRRFHLLSIDGTSHMLVSKDCGPRCVSVLGVRPGTGKRCGPVCRFPLARGALRMTGGLPIIGHIILRPSPMKASSCCPISCRAK